ncbi:MAG: hypothetical protein KJZ98_10855 [Burkholderiaceae bacterium]|nr:hypothetical protein [Burkholderiaceae bacterium]
MILLGTGCAALCAGLRRRRRG